MHHLSAAQSAYEAVASFLQISPAIDTADRNEVVMDATLGDGS